MTVLRNYVGILFLLSVVTLVVGVGCEQEVPVAPLAPPTKPPAGPLTETQLQQSVDRAIQITGDRVLDVDVNNAWQVVHGILAYGNDLKMKVKAEPQPVSALRWLFAGNVMDGWNLYPSEKGLDAELKPGSSEAQGHPDQWIGYLSLCGVKLDDKIIVPVGPNKTPTTFTMRDMIEHAKWSLREGQEATWTLMAFASYSSPDYLPINGQWTARDGTVWTFDKLVGMEADAGIAGAACGGSHRLYALSQAIQLQAGAGLPITGGFAKAEKVLNDAIRAAKEYQQPDGGFSNQMFYRSALSKDVDERINSTGHVFEVLAYALTDEDLRSPWFTRAAQFLCKKIEDSKGIPVSCGGLYHGAHGLMVYRDRRWGKDAKLAGAQ